MSRAIALPLLPRLTLIYVVGLILFFFFLFLSAGDLLLLVADALRAGLIDLGRVQFQSSKFQIFFPALAWRLKSRRNKKRIATAVCKWRDESNEPN